VLHPLNMFVRKLPSFEDSGRAQARARRGYVVKVVGLIQGSGNEPGLARGGRGNVAVGNRRSHVRWLPRKARVKTAFQAA